MSLSPEQQADLDEAYDRLGRLLDEQRHDDDCAYSCLAPDCGRDHHCAVCAEPEDEVPA